MLVFSGIAEKENVTFMDIDTNTSSLYMTFFPRNKLGLQTNTYLFLLITFYVLESKSPELLFNRNTGIRQFCIF